MRQKNMKALDPWRQRNVEALNPFETGVLCENGHMVI